MSAPLKRGACPSLHAPMQTGDGLLLRLGFRGGVTPVQLVDLAKIAGLFGNGLMEITARGNLQIRGLSETTAAPIAEAIEALGLPLQQGVPVEVGPLAGIDPKEIADPRPLAAAIMAGIEAEGLSERLGPKVSVIIDGGDRLGLDESPTDVRLVADGAQWLVLIGGTAASAAPYDLASVEQAPGLTLDILRRIAAKGVDCRGRDLAGEVVATGRLIAPSIRRTSPIGLHGLAGHAFAAGIGLPFGQIHADQLVALMGKTAALGIAEIRLSPRSLLAICATQQAANEFQGDANALGFITDPADARLAIIACAGKPACVSASITTKAVAAEIAAVPENGFNADFRLHVSGCEKRCAGTIKSGITVIGDPEGARLALEGEDSAIETRDVPANGIATAAIALAQRFRDEKPPKLPRDGFSASLQRSSVADPIHQRPR